MADIQKPLEGEIGPINNTNTIKINVTKEEVNKYINDDTCKESIPDKEILLDDKKKNTNTLLIADINNKLKELYNTLCTESYGNDISDVNHKLMNKKILCIYCLIFKEYIQGITNHKYYIESNINKSHTHNINYLLAEIDTMVKKMTDGKIIISDNKE